MIYFVILIVVRDTETQNRDKVSECNVEKGQYTCESSFSAKSSESKNCVIRARTKCK